MIFIPIAILLPTFGGIGRKGYWVIIELAVGA